MTSLMHYKVFLLKYHFQHRRRSKGSLASSCLKRSGLTLHGRRIVCSLVPTSLVTSLPAFLHPLLSAEISLHCSISVVKSEGEEGGGGGRRVLTTPFPPLLRRCEWQMQRRPPPRTQAHARSCRKKLPEQKRSFLLLSGDIVVVCTVCRSPLRCLSVKTWRQKGVFRAKSARKAKTLQEN